MSTEDRDPEESETGLAVHVERHRRRSGWMVRLSGVIDAALPTDEMLDGLEGAVVFDLERVEQITSFGVRQWCEAMQSIRTREIAFINIKPQVIVQFNVVDGFAGAGVLVSLYVPMFCSACDNEFDILVDLRTQWRDAVEGNLAPDCPKCGNKAELDDAMAYFDFVQQQGPPKLSDALKSVLEGGEDEYSLELKKRVEGTVTALWLSGSVGPRTRLTRVVQGLEGNVVAIFAGLMDIAEDCHDRLDPLLKTDPAVWLARVRPSILGTLSDEQRQLISGRVVSLWTRGVCRGCGAQTELEITADTCDRILAQTSGPICRTCGGKLKPKTSDEELKAYRSLMATDAPNEVTSYLFDHPGASIADVVDVLSISRRSDEGGESNTYRIRRHIGSGGMAQVFLARQLGARGFSKSVALKKLRPELAADTRFRRLFLDEARLAALINHPAVVQIFDLGRSGSDYFIVMEYVEGWNLSTLLRAAAAVGRKLPVELACYVGSRIAAGLHAAHTCRGQNGEALHIVHRDVSPQNVMVSMSGDVKLTDFGVARAATSTQNSGTETVLGKLAYMSPEQVDRGFGPVTPRSDVFCAGLVLFECLTGLNPFRQPSQRQTLKAILLDPPPNLEEQGSFDIRLRQILGQALARDPKQRYPSSLDFQKALDAYIAELGNPASSAYLATWLLTLAERSPPGTSTPNQLTTPGGATAYEDIDSTLRSLAERLRRASDSSDHPVERDTVEIDLMRGESMESSSGK